MTLRILSIYLLLFVTSTVNGQNWQQRTLMVIDDKEISAEEFVDSYIRSNSMGEKEDIDIFLDNFIIYKQKVADALSEGIDTTKNFLKELKGYRDHLAQDYLTDKTVFDELIEESYNRLLTEVNAWHILVYCPNNALPADTQKAYNKAINIRERIVQGENFTQVARGSSDDPSVKTNGGNLGFFTAFQTTRTFEDAAYSLPLGELSYPVRSADGYHIIKIVNRRPSHGSVHVRHIMKSVPKNPTKEENMEAESAINSIYDQLIEGASFEELAIVESDHKASASNGGMMEWFGVGEVIFEFSEAAFNIPDTGMFTRPVRTPDGWHIIKLIEKRPPPSFKESKSYLESRLRQSSLSSIARKAFINNLKNEYGYKIDSLSALWFVENSDTLITRGLTDYDLNKVPEGILYRFADRQVTNKEFAIYVKNRGPMKITDDPEEFFHAMIQENVSDRLIQYENNHLEEKYTEFRNLVDIFREGILVFEINDLRMRKTASNDTTGLMAYYEANKNKYLSDRQIRAKVYEYHVRNGEKTLARAYRKSIRKENSDQLMGDKLDTKNDTLLYIEEGIWIEGDDPVMDSLDWKRGIERTFINGYPAIVRILEVEEPAPLPFGDVEGEILSEYTESVGKRWIEQLNSKYPVRLDNSVLEVIKREIR